MNKGNGAKAAGSNGSIMAYTDLEKMQAIHEFLGEAGYAQPKFRNLAAEWYALDGLRADRGVIVTYNSWEYALAPGRQGQGAPAHIRSESGVLMHVEAQWSRGESGKPVVHMPLLHDKKDKHINSSELFRKVIGRMLDA